MSELPGGWVTAPIGSLCNLENGRAFKPTDWTDKGIPIVRIQNLNNKSASYNYFDGEYGNRYSLKGGELLFAWSGTPGTSFGAHIWHGGQAVLNQHIFRVDFDETSLDKRFFKHAINQKLEELIDIAHGGVGLRHVTKGKFEKTKIVLPPLDEQERIADKLDSLLARVDACRERLDRVPLILKRFRQSVLSAANSGQLTEDWRRAKESLVGNSPTDNAEPKSISPRLPGWEEMRIGDLLVDKPRNGYSPKAVEFETQTRSLTLTATTSGRFNPTYFKYIDEIIPEDSHLWLEPGDILIQRANTREYVGVSAVYDGGSHQFIYPDLMMKCRSNEKVMAKFLHYLLLGDGVREYFRANATGTAGNMPKINQQTVMSAPVHVAPLDEQAEIVRRVETLFAFADRLEARLSAARNRTDRLAPSLLAKAFRGELVPQDPNDEPASVLLERIRAEREECAKQPKTQKTKAKKEISAVMKKLIEVLAEAGDWVAAQEAFRRCGVAEGATTEQIEGLYAELRELDKSNLLSIEPVTNAQGLKQYDRLKLIGRG